MSSAYYGSYYGGQQYAMPDLPRNYPGNLLTHSNNGYYNGQQASGSYYNFGNDGLVNINYNYYGVGQVSGYGGYQHVGLTSPLGTNHNYYGGHGQPKPGYNELSEMQRNFDRYSAVEQLRASAMIGQYDKEFSSYRHSGNSTHSNPGPTLSGQQMPTERLYITNQVNDCNSVLINNHQSMDIANGLAYSLDANSALNGGFDNSRNQNLAPAHNPTHSQNITAPHHLEDPSTPIFGPGCSLNSNREFIDGFRSSWDNNSALIFGPGHSMNISPASISDSGSCMKANLTPSIGFISSKENLAPTNGFYQSQSGNFAFADGPSYIVDSNGIPIGIPIGSPSHFQDNNPIFTSDFASPINTNDALIKSSCSEPYPSRRRYEFITTTFFPSPPPTSFSPSSPSEKLIHHEYEDEENCRGNPLSSPFVKSLLRGPTSFENLARVEGISRTDLTPAYIPHCPHILKGRCQSASMSDKWCSDKVHFKRMVHAHTDVRLGDCSFLDSCDMMDMCPYIHYEPEFPETVRSHLDLLVEKNGKVEEEEDIGMTRLVDNMGPARVKGEIELDERSPPDIQHPPNIHPLPQWIKCDVRQLDLKILGKFGAIMADPPWDIRMTLPYGTVPDQAIIDLPFKDLQDEGVFFLWCTARAVDTGHACLKAWGYEFSDEIAWVKADHLKRLISVGRTGHWLNHTMEHCLVGIKGNPGWIRKGCDTDVIVSQPRATSHKPDEIYELIERLVGPHTRKLELFGREHNIRKGWLTLGNQLSSTYLYEENLKENLINELACKGNSRSYNPDWNPWAQGFTRYGYGDLDDWRNGRKISANGMVARGRIEKETHDGGDGGDDDHAPQVVPNGSLGSWGLHKSPRSRPSSVYSYDDKEEEDSIEEREDWVEGIEGEAGI